MNTETLINIINYFHVANGNWGNKLDFAKLNQKAIRFGYFIHPDCCTTEVSEWLDTLTENYNATFYKEWNDVIRKNRFELFVDQILHYCTTYGMDFEAGNGYVPNDGEGKTPSFKDVKVILPMSEEDIAKKCYGLITSGAALKESTMKNVVDFIIHCQSTYGFNIDVDDIKNREAQAYFCQMTKILPNDEFGILRCLVYAYTGSCMLIKNHKVFDMIRENACGDGMKLLLSMNDRQLEKLSRIFLRYKPLFLAMKRFDLKSNFVINKIRRLAVKNHTPLQEGFWTTLIAKKKDLSVVKEKVNELDNFMKVRLLNAVNVAMGSEEKSKIYNIRNGKTFVREDYYPEYDYSYLAELMNILRKSLVSSLSKKACKVSYNKHINLTLPSSEKSFVGNIPFGSSIELGKNSCVGIYWRNEWGTNDFDISMTDYNGEYIGWRGDYYNRQKSIVYSGDMTNADPEASELLYLQSDECPNGIVRVNQFRGYPVSRFRFFVASEEIRNPEDMSNYMVDPNNIRLDTMIDIANEPQKTLGLVNDGRLYIMDLHTGNSIVARSKSYDLEFINTSVCRTKCLVDLKGILEEAGFVEDDKSPDIDFNNLEKDTIINLLKEEDL